MKFESKSYLLAKKFLDKEVDVIIDRPLGSKHPKHEMIYQANYGFVPKVMAPDSEELDVYYLFDQPVENARGICIAIIHRLENDDDKLVVVPPGRQYSNEEIEVLVNFQEKYFKHEIIRN